MRRLRLVLDPPEGLRRQRRRRSRSLPAPCGGCVTAVASPTARGKTRVRTHPVIEVFGPTIQGEGAEAGVSTHFIRLGGCDYRCTWCDTMYAVDPPLVRANAERLSVDAILARVAGLEGQPRWVTLSGGNP